MRRILIKTAALLFIQGAAVAHASDVYVGVSVAGEVAPGVYGRVNIGNTPPPLLYAQPVVIVRQPRPMAPLYMHVPPGHAKKWEKHCHKYNACNRPVYFVKSAEYEQGYAPGPRGRDRQNDYRDDDRGNGRGNDHGNGHGKGHGNGRGNGRDH
ncbi:MAG TPA: hypothetical protein VJ654_02390 [Noviherbaspirillum sp.]|nr:hypothetical protein [Noviherbaspirillum sp.]